QRGLLQRAPLLHDQPLHVGAGRGAERPRSHSATGAGYQRTAKRNTVNACCGLIDGTPELKCAACSFVFIRRVGSMKRAAVSLSNARPRAAQRPIDQRLIAIIDIGSNSVRLVVYRGAVRVPPTIFNEKVMCGLAKGLAKTGLMD